MSITVEFFGIPRARAGVAQVEVLPDKRSAKFSEVLQALADTLPDFADACMTDLELNQHCIANIEGRKFVNGDAVIGEQQTVYILSADAGG